MKNDPCDTRNFFDQTGDYLAQNVFSEASPITRMPGVKNVAGIHS